MTQTEPCRYCGRNTCDCPPPAGAVTVWQPIVVGQDIWAWVDSVLKQDIETTEPAETVKTEKRFVWD